MPSHALDTTQGVWLISFSISTMLYGMGILQSWLYFYWYPKDSWRIKSVVLIVVVLETFQFVTAIFSIFTRLVVDFGDYESLLEMRSDIQLELLPLYLSAFVVQLYFATSLYSLNKKYYLVTGLIVSLAFLQIGAGIAETVKTSRLHSLTQLGETKALLTLQTSATMACDIVITVAICIALRNNRTGMKRTDTMLNMLITIAVNRGALTAICAAVTLIMFLTKPETFYFFLGLLISSRLYMNSMMATLNSRQYIRDTVDNPGGRPWDSIRLTGTNLAAPLGTHSLSGNRMGGRSIEFRANRDLSDHDESFGPSTTKTKTLDFA